MKSTKIYLLHVKKFTNQQVLLLLQDFFVMVKPEKQVIFEFFIIDGPLGAIVIAKSLKTLNKNVCLVTDENNKPIIEKAIEFSKLNIPLYVYPTGDDSIELSEKIIKEQSLDHVISIERIGPATDSHYYSMSGKDLTQYCGKTENLLKLAQEKNIKTTAIGDGGNELGMGKVYEKIKKFVNFGEKIACCLSADYVIIAGVSNWGGLAIASCLFQISKGNDLYQFLNTVEEESKLLEYIVKYGSIDGVTGKQEMSVDGFGYFDLHSKILEEIIKLNSK